CFFFFFFFSSRRRHTRWPRDWSSDVCSSDLAPDRSVQIVLIPAEQRDRSDLYRTASTDDSGRFALTDVAPGDYKLFAWEALDPYAYFDPKILEPFEQQGKPVHVAESTTANVEVEIIPK